MSQLPSMHTENIPREIIETQKTKQVYISEDEYRHLQQDKNNLSQSQIGSQLASQQGLNDTTYQLNQEKHRNCGHMGKSEGMAFPIQSTTLHSTVPGITPPFGYHGVAGCVICKGAGYIKYKNDRAKSCPDCVKDTHYCAVCNNTGHRIYDKKKKCTCIYAPK